MRPRIKHRILIASSDPDKIDSFRKELKQNHIQNEEYFKSLKGIAKIEVTIEYNYYIKCFGKLLLISKQEASILDQRLIIKKFSKII